MYKIGELTHMMTYNAIDHLGFFSRQIVLDNVYKAPNSAALAVAKIYPEEERPQKVTLDIGAGTGLLAEEVRDPPPSPLVLVSNNHLGNSHTDNRTYNSDPSHSVTLLFDCLLYTSPSPRDLSTSRMPSSA